MSDLSKDDAVAKKDLDNLKKELLEILVSKEDFKEQSDRLVTKEEFRQELAKLATRKSVEILANQLLKNTNDISVIKTRLNDIDWKIDDMREEIKLKFDAILNAVDNLSRKYDDDRTEKAAIDHALTRHDDRLDRHEVRITHLERHIA